MGERLDGTVALVTGASSGIGEATANALAAHGAAVALVARRKDRLDTLAAGIEAGGGRAVVIAADVTEPDQARSLVEQTLADLGRLDTVVNNAGVSSTSWNDAEQSGHIHCYFCTEEMSEQVWELISSVR